MHSGVGKDALDTASTWRLSSSDFLHEHECFAFLMGLQLFCDVCFAALSFSPSLELLLEIVSTCWFMDWSYFPSEIRFSCAFFIFFMFC